MTRGCVFRRALTTLYTPKMVPTLTPASMLEEPSRGSKTTQLGKSAEP